MGSLPTVRIQARAVVGLLAALVPLLTFAQRREGVYVPGGSKTGTSWSLNENHTLIWGGAPYLPVGIRIDGTPAAVQQAKAAGFDDVIVDVPASGIGWEETFAALNAAKMRFLLRVNSLAPMAQGFAVEPEAYRIAGIDKPKTITVDLPEATSAFVVLASRRDSSVKSSARVRVIDGKLTYEAKPAPGIEHVLLIYPETSSIEQPDFWEDLDSERDQLLGNLKHHPPGAGLRGIVNPMGRTLGLPGRQLNFIPTSSYFQMELRDLLEKRYKSVATAMRTWALTSTDLESFEDLARLVPLWRGSRGVSLLLDPKTNRTYVCDNRVSTIWTDMISAVSAAGARRFSRVVPAIRDVVDVPVIQEWAGWSATYETAAPIVDGIGMRAAGTTPSALLDTASRASSSVLRWGTKGWLIATDIDLGTGDHSKELPNVLNDLGSLGSRGFFIRSDSAPVIAVAKAEVARRAADTSLATTPLNALFYPENARNPAAPQQLPGGKWWLPAPSDGNRIDFGTLFWGYTMRSPEGAVVVIWAKTPGRYMLRMTNPKKISFASVDGHDCNPKLSKMGIEVDLTQYPTVISQTEEIPVPQLAFVETVFRFEYLMIQANKTLKDITEERVLFKDFVSGFERNPGGNYPQMRTQLFHLGEKVGDVTYIDAERTGDQNFSETPSIPGCIGGSALVLHTPIPPGPEGYYANYKVQVRSKEDQTLWLAASIPPEQRGLVTISVEGQTFGVSEAPVSLYGDGYGWYKLGVTRLAGNMAKVLIRVNGSGNLPIALDAIVLTPRPFAPDGITLPDPVEFPPVSAKAPKESGKKGRKSGN